MQSGAVYGRVLLLLNCSFLILQTELACLWSIVQFIAANLNAAVAYNVM